MVMSVSKTQETVTLRDLGCPRLYREDLRSIARALGQIGTLTITCSGEQSETRGAISSFEATDPNDFEELPEKLISVVISSAGRDSSGMTVRLSPRLATAELTAPTVETIGALVGVQDVCNARGRRLRSWVRWAEVRVQVVSFIVFLGVLIAAPVGVSYFVALHRSLSGGGAVILGWNATYSLVLVIDIILLAAATGIIWLAGTPKAVIINWPSAERPTYWKRNADTIWITTVIGVLTTVLGYILGKLF